jgi:hypothetical protein
VKWQAKAGEARRILNRLGKMRAATAAGVFAKATIVTIRGKYMTAPTFVASLASDLVSNPTLRASIWPPEMA